MTDLIVTTPKRDIALAAREAAGIIAAGGGSYFRLLSRRVVKVNAGNGDRMFYVEDGFIRGFANIIKIRFSRDGRGVSGVGEVCSTTGVNWGIGTFAIMDAATWQWVLPVPCRGFQGWRYFYRFAEMVVVGDWRSPRPPIHPGLT